MQGNLAGNYVLGADIDARPTASWNGNSGFTPVGTATTLFTGRLEGLGHVVDGLVIHRPRVLTNLGLFGGMQNALVSNLGLTNVNITGRTGTTMSTGALAGYAESSTFHNVFATGRVEFADFIGGLVGWADSVTVRQSHTSMIVFGEYAGGLGGMVMAGTIDHCYATGSVAGNYAGGLAGKLDSPGVSPIIRDSYSIVAVNGSTAAGGIVGETDTGGAQIENTYAAGPVSGNLYTGSIVGNAFYGNSVSITNSYWNADMSSSGAVGSYGWNAPTLTNVAGLTTDQMRNPANFAGFTFTTTPGDAGWVMVGSDSTINGNNGAVLPMLASEWSFSIANAHQLQLMAMNKGASYTLARNMDATATDGVNFADVWLASSFVAVGSSADPFTGRLDGQYHVIDGLFVDHATRNDQGLIGFASGATLSDIGLTNVSINGQDNTGALLGYGNNNTTIARSYATGTVSGRDNTGGLVGYQDGSTLSDSYASVAVSGGVGVGGLIGDNFNGTVRDSYATGTASGASSVGGLAGVNGFGGTVEHSFWDTATSGTNTGVGTSTGALIDFRGLVTADMHTLANYANAGWSIDDVGGTDKVWRIYDGYTYPLLRGFLTPITVAIADDAKIYDGNAYTGGNGYTISDPTAPLLGSATYGGTAQGARGAGTYAIGIVGLYTADQQGYDVVAREGTLTVNKVNLTVTADDATKTYDGKPWQGGNGVRYAGFIPGESAADLSSSLVWSGDSQGAVALGQYTLAPGGLTSTNYDIAFVGGRLSIVLPAILTNNYSSAVTSVDQSGSGNQGDSGNGLSNRPRSGGSDESAGGDGEDSFALGLPNFEIELCGQELPESVNDKCKHRQLDPP